MDKIGTAPMINDLKRHGGFPIIQEKWSPFTFDMEYALVSVRLVNVFPLVAVGIEADMYNTSRKILYVS